MSKHARKDRWHADDDGTFIVAFALAWGVGGVAVGAAEQILTGENILDTGGSWQSWTAGVLVAILTFVIALIWQRRRAKTTPPKTTRTEPLGAFTVSCSICNTPVTCPNCSASGSGPHQRGT